MKLEFLVTLANSKVSIPFRVMERSLRATGCDLPLRVIPYDDNLFDLPANAAWWCVPELIDWAVAESMHPTMRKYQCLTVANYHFVDSDVVFVRNPTTALGIVEGLVTSCGHWKNTAHAVTADSARIFRRRSTTWEMKVFNTGQFACDRSLFTPTELIRTAELPEYSPTAKTFPHHEQPGLNLLAHVSGISVSNLTLPPYHMESTWAGDYDEAYEMYWSDPDRTPYLIHWAGTKPTGRRPIDDLFYRWLTPDERVEWDTRQPPAPRRSYTGRVIGQTVRRVRRATAALWRAE